MAVGKGSMARASKAVKKTTEPVEEKKPVGVEEVKEVKEVKPAKAEKKPTAKKTVEKKSVKEQVVPEEEYSNGIVALGDELPVFYL